MTAGSMPEKGERVDRALEGGWRLQGVGDAQASIRLVFGDTELARAYPGLVVGRHPALCDRVLEDLTISHRHCRFSMREGMLFVEDLNSLNGTEIAGQSLAPFRTGSVLPGQTITLGRLPLLVQRIAPGGRLR